jgi:hypothetical protein
MVWTHPNIVNGIIKMYGMEQLYIELTDTGRNAASQLLCEHLTSINTEQVRADRCKAHVSVGYQGRNFTPKTPFAYEADLLFQLAKTGVLPVAELASRLALPQDRQLLATIVEKMRVSLALMIPPQ